MADLLRAVERGLVEPLASHGFAASGGGGLRGETVECSNGATLITVVADWLEGELELTVQRVGEPAVALENVIDPSQIQGLHLRRLGRGVSTATVEAQLRKIASALQAQAPNLLTAAAKVPIRSTRSLLHPNMVP